VLAYFFKKKTMKLFLLPIAVVLTGQALAQSVNSHSSITSKSSSTGFMVMMIDKDGKPFTYGNSDVEGNPFYNENWGRVNLKLTNGSIHKDVSARLNTYNNYLHFMGGKNVEMYFEAGEVSRVELLDSLTKDSVLLSFVRLTTTENGKDAAYFYKVLAEGNIMLLERHRKKRKENKADYSGEIKRFYEQYEDYYVFAGNQLAPAKRKESFWAELMKDKWTAVQAHAEKNKLGFKSFDDLQKIVAFYNTLPAAQ
jgi:hypothetical protein